MQQLPSRSQFLPELFKLDTDENLETHKDLKHLNVEYRLEFTDHLNFSNITSQVHSKRQTLLSADQSGSSSFLPKKRSTMTPSTFAEPIQKTVLKKIIKKNKTDRLVENFISKLRRSVPSAPESVLLQHNSNFFDSFDSGNFSSVLKLEGIEMRSSTVASLNAISIILSLLLNVVYQLELIFPQITTSSRHLVSYIETVCLAFFAVEFVLNTVRKRYEDGKSLVYVRQILSAYAKSEMFVDCLVMFIVVVSVCGGVSSPSFLKFRLLVILKLGQIPEQANAIQKIISNDFLKQQYYGIFVVFLINFLSAHVLSLILVSMHILSPESNWLTERGIQNAYWYEQYIWGLYWAAAIMLTIGFGDISATNYKEAACLVIVEMVSCMLLSYNINYVGNLINNIRQKGQEKKRNLNTFTTMARQNQVPFDLESRIKSHIEGSFLIKNDFNFTQQNHLLDKLPQYLRREYLNEANQKIFSLLPVLKNLTCKVRSLLAQQIVRLVAHPEEIVQKCGYASRLLILQKGTVGLCTRGSNHYESGSIIQTVSTDSIDASTSSTRLLNLCFLKPQRVRYNTKSISYCVIFQLQQEQLIRILKHSHFDYEYYCQLRDQSDYDLNALQLFKCDICLKDFHSKFDCPKLHYIPLREFVIWKKAKIQQKHFQMRLKRGFRRPRMSQMPIQLNHKVDVETYNYISLHRLNTTLSNPIGDRVVDDWERKNSTACEQSESSNFYEAIMEKLDKIAGSEIRVQEIVDVDVMHNWRHYFPSYNPRNLQSRFQKRSGLFNWLRQRTFTMHKDD